MLNNVPSGIFMEETLEFDIVDYDGQVVRHSNNGIVKISAVTGNSSISGYDFSVIVNGTVKFDHLKFISRAGAKNVRYKLNSTQISTQIVSSLSKNSSSDLENLLIVSFRQCKPGERITQNNQ